MKMVTMELTDGYKLLLLLLFDIISHVPVCNAILELTFTENKLMKDKLCRPGDLLMSLNVRSAFGCLHVCTRQFNTSSGFHNSGSGACHCCSRNYTVPDGLPSEKGTNYFSTAPSSFKDCLHAQASGVNVSGVQSIITPVTGRTIDVFCDMDTAGGGWTVFQNRFNGSVDFYRNFTDYQEGFGDVRGEYWLGLQNIHELTNRNWSLVYVHFVDVNNTTAFEMFRNFFIREGPDYILLLGKGLEANDGTVRHQGGLRDSFKIRFSTPDVDRDESRDRHCAVETQSGWWHASCTHINVNGRYAEPGTQVGAAGMRHDIWRNGEALKATRLMFRRQQ